jgi:hypothetical protein
MWRSCLSVCDLGSAPKPLGRFHENSICETSTKRCWGIRLWAILAHNNTWSTEDFCMYPTNCSTDLIGIQYETLSTKQCRAVQIFSHVDSKSNLRKAMCRLFYVSREPFHRCYWNVIWETSPNVVGQVWFSSILTHNNSSLHNAINGILLLSHKPLHTFLKLHIGGLN